MSDKKHELNCLKSQAYGTGCSCGAEPVASPQATEMQTRILDAAYAQQKRMEAASPQATMRMCTGPQSDARDCPVHREDVYPAAQPAAGTTPQAERQRRVQQEIANGVCRSIDLLHGERGEDARAVAPVETRQKLEPVVLNVKTKPNGSEYFDFPFDPDVIPPKAAPETRLTAEQFWPDYWKTEWDCAPTELEPDDACMFAEAFRDKSESTVIQRLKAKVRDVTADLENRSIEFGEAQGLLKRSREEYAGLREEIERLRAWKESQMAVTPDWQKIGELLNIGLGQSVTENIIPAITELRVKLAEQERETKSWMASLRKVYEDWDWVQRDKCMLPKSLCTNLRNAVAATDSTISSDKQLLEQPYKLLRRAEAAEAELAALRERERKDRQ